MDCCDIQRGIWAEMIVGTKWAHENAGFGVYYDLMSYNTKTTEWTAWFLMKTYIVYVHGLGYCKLQISLCQGASTSIYLDMITA